MAEFCADCAAALGERPGLAGEVGVIEYYLFRRTAFAVCEGCGPVEVDCWGRKIKPERSKNEKDY